MYFVLGIFLVICVVFFCVQFYRRKRIICKVRQMDKCEKACFLNKLLVPFGFCYEPKQDIITTTLDAWQRKFGYCSLFDYTALRFSMVFDYEPIYFYYHDRTYRIELWKGQYGINAGAEAGIYFAEGILPPEQFDRALFQSVSDQELLQMDLVLYDTGKKLYRNSGKHWWLTGFCMGKYCEPEDLAVQISIQFPDQKMLSAFVESLARLGYQKSKIHICDLNVSFWFISPGTKQERVKHRLLASFEQWKNRNFVKLYLRITNPFYCTPDRLLYLYFFLPRIFRRMFIRRKNRRQKFHRSKRAGA